MLEATCGGVHENSTILEGSVHISHHRANISATVIYLYEWDADTRFIFNYGGEKLD